MKYDYASIEGFNFWCQKVLPLVYDDSLSYYEVLCKIQSKLNEVINNQNNLNAGFSKLLEWVDSQLLTYSKEQLTKWSKDGTFAKMINEELFKQLNIKINNNTNSIKQMTHILQPNEDLQAIINSGILRIELDPNQTYSFTNIKVPSNFNFNGKNAIVKNSGLSPIFNISDKTNVSITNVFFKGYYENANNQPLDARDIGIEIIRANEITISDCVFKNFRGVGISLHELSASYYRADTNISNNSFNYCYVGLCTFNYYEYFNISNNHFMYCRIGIWSQSGNTNINNNTIVKCRCAIVYSYDTTQFVPAKGGNGGHGSFTGNIVNHCNPGEEIKGGWSDANYLILDRDYTSIWVDGNGGMIPPTFTGNTCYYTSLLYKNSVRSNMNSWRISGNIFSNAKVSVDTWGRLISKSMTTFSNFTNEKIFPSPATALELETGVTSITPCRFYIDDNLMVHLDGRLNPNANEGLIARLPTYASPAGNNWVVRVWGDNTNPYIYITPKGEINVVGANSKNISLDNIIFPSNLKITY